MTEKWYVYKSNRDDDGWRQRRIEATSPDRTIGMSVEWSLLACREALADAIAAEDGAA